MRLPLELFRALLFDLVSIWLSSMSEWEAGRDEEALRRWQLHEFMISNIPKHNHCLDVCLALPLPPHSKMGLKRFEYNCDNHENWFGCARRGDKVGWLGKKISSLTHLIKHPWNWHFNLWVLKCQNGLTELSTVIRMTNGRLRNDGEQLDQSLRPIKPKSTSPFAKLNYSLILLKGVALTMRKQRWDCYIFFATQEKIN